MTGTAKERMQYSKIVKEKHLSKPTKSKDYLVNTTPTGFFHRRPVQVVFLALLLTVIAAPSMLPKFSVVDPDIWWHLKVGDWIIQHSGFPHVGILSRTAADRPWMAYSWIYELLLAFFHSRFHLMGISVYGLLLTTAVSYSVFWMTFRLSARFWVGCLLATLCCDAFLFKIYPRPAFLSMVYFTITLTLLIEARREGRQQLLYWLPPLFLLWANSHIQFVYGLFVVGLFVAVNLAEAWAAQRRFATECLDPQPLSPRTLSITFLVCILATCIGPYSFHLYSVVFHYAMSKFPYAHIAEFQSLSFRTYTDFVQLLLVVFAFFGLGRQKTLDLFLLCLLVAASMVGFRTSRDAWFICIPAAACLACSFRSPGSEYHGSLFQKVGLICSVALLFFLYARLMNVNTQELRLAIAARYPVRAINYLHDHPQTGPIYNTFNWGGFIAWYLPEYPVAIDGRTDLYGDDMNNRFHLTENGDPSYADDPYLNEAKFFVIPKQLPLARVLGSDVRFSVIYEDSLSMVFVRR